MIDVKSLTIGSHVSMNGVRARVVRLTTVDYGHGDRWHILFRGVSPDDGIEREVGSFVDDNAVQPISITPALLEELGFENTSSSRRITYTKGCEYDGLWVEIRNLKDRWDMFVSNNDWDGRTVVRYLHEAEAFLALHGVELIPD